MLSTPRNQSFEGDIFQNHLLQSFSVKNNPIYQVEMANFTPGDDQGNNVDVEVSEQSISGTEIRILIDEENGMDFTTTNRPAATANKIVISYSSRGYTTRLMEITLGLTGQAAVSLLAYASTTATTSSSSNSPRGLNFVVAANAVGFIGTFLGIWFRRREKRMGAAASVSVVGGKIGAISAACAIIVAMGVFLPANAIYMWIVGFVCLFPAAAVVFS
ncbi:hypothetical protein HAX54_033108 [Datura stramonium]|uniref:Uncharacterized protein n=1 Tax=Datura stramonium TaxID=4076 RepID=A0ABS8VF43_DATST|nr:hypothetical protein [Datura stramonium]